MATILDDILAHKRQEVTAQKQRVDMDTLVANIRRGSRLAARR